MKRYLIDTNVISELRKKKRCNPNVRQWFETVDDSTILKFNHSNDIARISGNQNP